MLNSFPLLVSRTSTGDGCVFFCGTCGLLSCSCGLPWSCSVCCTHALAQRLPLPLRAYRFYDGAKVISTDVAFRVAEDATPGV